MRYGMGGVETQTEQLARVFLVMGYQVCELETYHLPWGLIRLVHVCRAVLPADVVLSMGLSLKTWLVVALLGRPVLISHHTYLGGNGWNLRLKRWILRRSFHVANSFFLAEKLRELADLPRLPIAVIHPCCPLECLASQVGPDHSPTNRPGWDVTFVGRHIPDKGGQVLLAALEKLAAFGCGSMAVAFLGAGPAQPEWQRLSLACGQRVSFLGSLPASEVAVELRRSRLVVIPSLWQEPFGVVMLEALAAGCGVIASAVGGLPEAGGQLARFVPPGDVEALADAIRNELTHPVPIDWAARQAHLERFRPERVAQLHLQEINRLLAARAAA